MNTAFIICMHGNLALEMLKTSELIIGKQNNIISIPFLENENVDNIVNKYKKELKKLNLKKGVIFFVDIIGGSPYNAANIIINENKKLISNIITGTNIPMLLEILMCRNNNNIHQLTKIAIENGKNGINSLN